MATIHPVSMRDTARDCTIRLEVKHAKRTRLRLWLFGCLLKAAVAVAPVDVEVVSV